MSEARDASSEPASARPSTTAAPKTRRRNRIITSCLECRRRKLKCDKKYPCDHCHKGNRDCVFLAPARDPVAQQKLNQLKDNIELFEKELEAGVEGSEDTQWIVSAQSTKVKVKPEDAPTDLRDEILEPTPLAVDAVAYENDDDDDTLDDLGIRLGRMRVTERIGGSVRPMFSFEISDIMRRSSDKTNTDADASLDEWAETGVPEDFLAPSPEYLAPGSGLVFPSFSGDHLSVINFLPSRQVADVLLENYWIRVHPIARLLHRPSFERQYIHFWQAISTGFEPKFSLQAIVFAAIFSGAVSMSAASLQLLLSVNKQDLVKSLQTATEHALSRANLMKTTKTETLQAFTIYLIPVCRKEMSRAHGAVTSMAIRLAMMAGLHRDGTAFGLPPVETHVRRLVWHQLCRLDLRTCQALGPQQFQIRLDEYDTKFPLNVDDIDLEGLIAPTTDAERFTDNTINRLRLEMSEFSREMFVKKQKVDMRQTALSAALKRVEDWFNNIEARYVPLLDEDIPLQALGRRLLHIGRRGFYIGLLHQYVVSAPRAMPPRLLDLVWESGIVHTETSIELETVARFEPWAWYSGAFQNWHVALLLFAEVVRRPERPGADRIWRIMDYVFELPPHLTRPEKSMYLAVQARSRMTEYERRRRRRLPVELQRSLGVVHWSQAGGAPAATNEAHKVSHTSPAPAANMYGSPDSGSMPPSNPVPPRVVDNTRTSNSFAGPYGASQAADGSSSMSSSHRLSEPHQQQTAGTGGYGYKMGMDHLFSDGASLQGIEWDEIDKLFQMDTSLDMEDMSSASTMPGMAPPNMSGEFDISALNDMGAMPSMTTLFPPMNSWKLPKGY